MLFGRSLFESVLERLREETGPEAHDEPSPAPARFRAFGESLVGAALETADGDHGRMERGYLEALGGIKPPPPPEPQIPPHLLRLALEEIAEDLALAQDDDAQTLHEKRRAFARRNHPDGFAAPFRDKANIRMALANLMVDEALRRCPRNR